MHIIQRGVAPTALYRGVPVGVSQFFELKRISIGAMSSPFAMLLGKR